MYGDGDTYLYFMLTVTQKKIQFHVTLELI